MELKHILVSSVILLFLFTLSLAEDPKDDEDDDYVYYTGYLMVKIEKQETMDNVDVLIGLREKYEKIPEGGNSRQIVFLDDILLPKTDIFLVVAPDVREDVKDVLTENKMKHKVLLEDLQLTFDYNWERNEFQKTRYKDTIDQEIFMAPFYYMKYNEMASFAEYVVTDLNQRGMGNWASIFSIGKSHEGRDIVGISLNDDRKDLPAVWIDAGLDPRVYLAPSTVIFLLWEIANKNEEDSVFLRDNFRWYFIPNTNPDGYTHNIYIDRLWRKNTRPQADGCIGVDLTRNFETNFGGPGTSDDPCNDKYKGSEALSEPETRALAEALKERKNDINLYITLQSFGNNLYLPWAGRDMRKPEDYDDLIDVATKAVESVKVLTTSPPEVGTPPDIRYPLQGNVLDYAKKLGIKYTYGYALRPQLDEIPLEANYFDLPPTFIHVNGPEFVTAVLRMCREIHKNGSRPNMTKQEL